MRAEDEAARDPREGDPSISIASMAPPPGPIASPSSDAVGAIPSGIGCPIPDGSVSDDADRSDQLTCRFRRRAAAAAAAAGGHHAGQRAHASELLLPCPCTCCPAGLLGSPAAVARAARRRRVRAGAPGHAPCACRAAAAAAAAGGGGGGGGGRPGSSPRRQSRAAAAAAPSRAARRRARRHSTRSSPPPAAAGLRRALWRRQRGGGGGAGGGVGRGGESRLGHHYGDVLRSEALGDREDGGLLGRGRRPQHAHVGECDRERLRQRRRRDPRVGLRRHILRQAGQVERRGRRLLRESDLVGERLRVLVALWRWVGGPSDGGAEMRGEVRRIARRTKKPDAGFSLRKVLWSMTVRQLLMLPISSRTVGCSAAKRHSLSTMNLYWYVPGGRFKHTTWSCPLRRSGIRSPHALKLPVTKTAAPPIDHWRTVGTAAASAGGGSSLGWPPISSGGPVAYSAGEGRGGGDEEKRANAMAARNGRMRRSAPMVPAEAEAAVEARRRVGKARARAVWQKRNCAHPVGRRRRSLLRRLLRATPAVPWLTHDVQRVESLTGDQRGGSPLRRIKSCWRRGAKEAWINR